MAHATCPCGSPVAGHATDELKCPQCGKTVVIAYLLTVRALEDQICAFEPDLLSRVLDLATAEVDRRKQVAYESLVKAIGLISPMQMEDDKGHVSLVEGFLVFLYNTEDATREDNDYRHPFDVVSFVRCFRESRYGSYTDPGKRIVFHFSLGEFDQTPVYSIAIDAKDVCQLRKRVVDAFYEELKARVDSLLPID